jgi:hypothetical protein
MHDVVRDICIDVLDETNFDELMKSELSKIGDKGNQCKFLGHLIMDVVLGGALENWPNFQTPLLLMKLWDLLDNMCVVVDLKFEQKNPPGSASSSSKTR